MVRTACVSFYQLPLQILLQAHQDWLELPTALIKDEKPISPILDINKTAKDRGLKVGNKYSEALGLVPDLRAGVVRDNELQLAYQKFISIFQLFSPEVEHCSFDSEVFWLNASGLTSVFGSLEQWLLSLRASINAHGFQARICIGYSRFCSYSMVKTASRSMVLNGLDEERRLLEKAPISVFPLSLRSQRLLERLGIKKLKDFLELPLDGTLKRFDSEVRTLLEVFRTDQSLPIQPVKFAEPIVITKRFDSPLFSNQTILENLDELLNQLMSTITSDSKCLASIQVEIRDEDHGNIIEIVKPAKPTQNLKVFLRLIDLRFSNKQYQSGIEQITIQPEIVSLSREQPELFSSNIMDLEAGTKAFSLIQAKLGNKSICVAQLCNSHLPEQSFVWVPVSKPKLPTSIVKLSKESRSIRKILTSPRLLSKPTISGSNIAAPVHFSGNWWTDSQFNRRYWFRKSDSYITWGYEEIETRKQYLQGFVD